MALNILKDYLSRKQMSTYFEYVEKFGLSNVLDQGDGAHYGDPVDVRLGSTISSVKDYHVMRLNPKAKLKLHSGDLIKGSSKPALPIDAEYVGIFYLGKSSEENLLAVGPQSASLVGGDVVWMTASDYELLMFGNQDNDRAGRLVVFWSGR